MQWRRKREARIGVVLIHMQPAFVQNIGADEANRMVEAQCEVLEVCVSKDYPVVKLELRDLPGLHHYFGETLEKLSEIIGRAPRNASFKNYGSNGYNSVVESQFNEWEVNTFCLMGVELPYCVINTAKGVVRGRKDIITARSLIAAEQYDPKVEESLKWFRHNGKYFEDHADLLNLMRREPRVNLQINEPSY